MFFFRNSCAAGYEKDKVTNKCEDSNECENGKATCHPTDEACFNTRGSYKCLPILSPLDETHCEDGFRYNARINQCVGEFQMLIYGNSAPFIFNTNYYLFVLNRTIFRHWWMQRKILFLQQANSVMHKYCGKLPVQR